MRMKTALTVFLALLLLTATAMAQVLTPDMTSKTLVGWGTDVAFYNQASFTWAIDAETEAAFPDEALPFINSHKDAFPVSTQGALQKVNALVGTAERKQLLKNPFKYMNQFVAVSGIVAQVTEEKTSACTEIILVDGNSDVWDYVTLGSVDVFEQDRVTICGLPLASASYKAASGTQVQYVALLGGYVAK